MTRSILKHMGVPNYIWGEVVRHATYLINRSATRTLISKTPYEMFRGSKPNISHVKVFGCIGYARIEAPHKKKLDDRYEPWCISEPNLVLRLIAYSTHRAEESPSVKM